MLRKSVWPVGGAAISAAAASYLRNARKIRAEENQARSGVLSAIGNTPLIELHSLSRATGCRILGKCEHLNPGGSVKDRAALFMIEEAERRGLLKPGGCVYEGTGGNTGVGLAMVCAAKGYKSCMVMPASIAQEKISAMEDFGARIILTPGVPFSSDQHYYHVAGAAAAKDPLGVFTNQFENKANMTAHLKGTGPEIWRQAEGGFDGFVCSSGTGGTIAGCSAFFKAVNPNCQCYVIDPPGSALFDYIRTGVFHMETVLGVPTKFIERSPGTSVTEGIGIDRVTANFAEARIDGTMQGTDREAVEMAFWMKENDGVHVGPSAALNCVGAVKLARKLGPGHTVVTVLCDGGSRYQSKLGTHAWLEERDLVPRSGLSADLSWIA